MQNRHHAKPQADPGSPSIQPDPLRKAFRPEEAARALGIGRTQIFALMRDKFIRSFKIGKCRLILASDLETFLATAASQGE